MNVSDNDFKYMVRCIMRDLVNLLVVRYDMNIKEALRTLYNSETYRSLKNPSSGLYYQSPLYTYAYLENEIRTGKM